MIFDGHTKIGSNAVPNPLMKTVRYNKTGGFLDAFGEGFGDITKNVTDSVKNIGDNIQGHFNNFLNNSLITNEPSVKKESAVTDVVTDDSPDVVIDDDIAPNEDASLEDAFMSAPNEDNDVSSKFRPLTPEELQQLKDDMKDDTPIYKTVGGGKKRTRKTRKTRRKPRKSKTSGKTKSRRKTRSKLQKHRRRK